jgi:hypothetical protein
MERQPEAVYTEPKDAKFTDTASKSKVRILDIIQQNKKGAEHSILTSPGSAFPFIGRQKEARVFYQYFTTRLRDSSPNFVNDKESAGVSYLAGFPGLGKTRFNVEAKNMLITCNKEMRTSINKLDKKRNNLLKIVNNIDTLLDESVFILMTYGNKSYSLTEVEDTIDPVHAFWIRVLYFFFAIDMSLEDFITQFKEVMFTPEEVLDAILSACTQSDKLSEERFTKMIHFGIDEYNYILESSGRKALPNIVDSINTAIEICARRKVLLTALFTGITSSTFTVYFTGCYQIPYGPLSFEASCKLLLEISNMEKPLLTSNEWSGKLKKEQIFSRKGLTTLLLMGGIARCIEYYVAMMIDNGRASLRVLLTTISSLLETRYNLVDLISVVGDRELTYKLLQYSILRIPVATRSSLQHGAPTLDQLQQEGLIMLQLVPHDDTAEDPNDDDEEYGEETTEEKQARKAQEQITHEVLSSLSLVATPKRESKQDQVIVLPYIWLSAFIHHLKPTDFPGLEAIELVLESFLNQKWDEFQKVNAYYLESIISFWGQAIKDCQHDRNPPYVSLTYERLLGGASFHNFTVTQKRKEINFEKIDLTQLKAEEAALPNQYPENESKFKMEKYYLGANYSGAALDVILKMDKRLLGSQAKYTSAQMGCDKIIAKTVEEEYKKSLKVVQRSKDWLSLDVFLFVSNRPYTGVAPTVPVALVTRGNIKRFYGETLGSLLLYTGQSN